MWEMKTRSGFSSSRIESGKPARYVFTAAPVAMTQDPNEPRIWYGPWDTTGLSEGETTLTVTALGTATHSAAITVTIADVSCPPAPPIKDPDAGPSDGGPGTDAGSEPDSGTGTDAAPGADGGAAAAFHDDGGCGCRTGDQSAPPLALLLLLGWLARRARMA